MINIVITDAFQKNLGEPKSETHRPNKVWVDKGS